MDPLSAEVLPLGLKRVEIDARSKPDRNKWLPLGFTYIWPKNNTESEPS